MRIIARKVQNYWSARFAEGSTAVSDGPDPVVAIRQLIQRCLPPNITIRDFKPDFSASGTDCLVMVLDNPCPQCDGTGKTVVADAEQTCSECQGKGQKA